MKYTSLFAAAYIAVVGFQTEQSFAQNADDPVSQCLAIAQSEPRIILAATSSSPLAIKGDVTITYSGHSTFRIETPEGVVAATDFSGLYGIQPSLPRIVTMNRAHSSHHTLSPDPVDRVCIWQGWNDMSTRVRLTMIWWLMMFYVPQCRKPISGSFGDGMIADGNSIFIFRRPPALCIGHLGHLHHPLDR